MIALLLRRPFFDAARCRILRRARKNRAANLLCCISRAWRGKLATMERHPGDTFELDRKLRAILGELGLLK